MIGIITYYLNKYCPKDAEGPPAITYYLLPINSTNIVQRTPKALNYYLLLITY